MQAHCPIAYRHQQMRGFEVMVCRQTCQGCAYCLDECNFQVRAWIIWNKNLAQFGAIGSQYKIQA
jgi:Fe-S-cluster-containing dehydrogenase component